MDTCGRDNLFGSMLNKVIEDLNKPETIVKDKKTDEKKKLEKKTTSEGKIPDVNKDSEEKKIKKLTEEGFVTAVYVEPSYFEPGTWNIFLEKGTAIIPVASSGNEEEAIRRGEKIADALGAKFKGAITPEEKKIEEGKIPDVNKDSEEKKIRKLTEEGFEEQDKLDLETAIEILHGQWNQTEINSKSDLITLLKDMLQTAQEIDESKIREDEEIDILNDDVQSILDDEYDGVEILDEAKKKKVSRKGRPLKKGAKVRSRGDCVFPYASPKVTDNKDHFPINNENQARNALARASQYKSSPPWYKGSLESLVKKVQSAVHKKYPDIKVTKKSATPGKG